MSNILPINQDPAGVEVIKAHEQVDERRLAAARPADDGHTLSLMHLQIDILDQRPLRIVGKAYVLQLDVAPFHLQGWQTAVIGLWLLIQYVKMRTALA